MIKIFMCISLAIASIFSISCGNIADNNVLSAKCMSINAISGTSNTGNIFTDIRYFRLFNTSTGWSVLKNYYSSGLDYVVNGVVSDDEIYLNTLDEYNRLSLDLQFNSLVHISPQTPLNVQLYSGVLNSIGSGNNITSQGSGPSVAFQVSSDFGSTWSVHWGVPYTYSSGLVTFTFGVTGNYNLIRIMYNCYSLTNNPHLTFAYYGALYEESVYDSSYQAGYNYANTQVDTNSASYSQGRLDGINYANTQVNDNSASYDAGYNAGSNDAGSLSNLFSGVLQAPVNVVMNALDFEIFGVNVSTFVLSLLTVGFIAIIIKLLL